MAIKTRSRREKVGGGLGLLLGIIGFNLLVPFLFEKQAGFDGNQLLWAAVTALVCAELGGQSGQVAGSPGANESRRLTQEAADRSRLALNWLGVRPVMR